MLAGKTTKADLALRESPAPVAVYDRLIAASLERIWENVLDWEHLPWLHRRSFTDIRLLDAGRDGWRACVALQGTAGESHIDVRLDKPNLQYWARTLDGVGAGTEILTRLQSVSERATRIAVEFRVPGVDPDHADAVGSVYTRLYTRLWDEDETMMVRRQRLLDRECTQRTPERLVPPAVLALGSITSVRGRLPMLVEVAGRSLRLVAVGEEILVHPTTCPHLGGPLDAATVEDGWVRCPWHGFRFDLRSGKNLNGRACHLGSVPRVRVDAGTDNVSLVWP